MSYPGGGSGAQWYRDFCFSAEKAKARRAREITESLSWVWTRVCGILKPWANVPPSLPGLVLSSEIPKCHPSFPTPFHIPVFSPGPSILGLLIALTGFVLSPLPMLVTVCLGSLLRVTGRKGHSLLVLVTTSLILDSISLMTQLMTLVRFFLPRPQRHLQHLRLFTRGVLSSSFKISHLSQLNFTLFDWTISVCRILATMLILSFRTTVIPQSVSR